MVSSLSAGLEAKSIVSLIQHVRSESPALEYHDFVVLYRTNAQSLPLQVEFILNDIPYYVRKEDNILQNEHLDKLLSILRLKLASDEHAAPSARDAARTACSFFRYVEPKIVARLEAHFRHGGDFMDTIRSGKLRELAPVTGWDTLPFAVYQLLAARSLPAVLGVILERFRGLKGMIGGLEEAIEEKMPLGEINEIAVSFGGDIKGFVSSFESALERARASNAGQDQGRRAVVDLLQSEGIAVAHGHFDNVQRWSDPASAGRGRGRTPPVLRGHDAGFVQSGFVLRPKRLFVQSPAQPISLRGWLAGKARDGAKKKSGKRRRFQRSSRPRNRLRRNSKIKGVPSA